MTIFHFLPSFLHHVGMDIPNACEMIVKTVGKWWAKNPGSICLMQLDIANTFNFNSLDLNCLSLN